MKNNLTNKMKEAIELLKREEFYLYKTDRNSVWLSYTLGVPIYTRTMNALEKKGIVKFELAETRNAELMAELSKEYK